MEDPAFLAVLAVNEIDEGEMGRATAPNAPDRACSSCGTGFRARLARCPGCGSSRLARVLHKRGREFWHHPVDESGSKEASEAEAARRHAARVLAEKGDDKRLTAEILRLLNDGRGAMAEWKALQAELGFVSLPHSGAINRPTLACAECPKRFRLRPVRCPKCGSEEIARIQYGYPARMPDEDDWVELGGCCVGPDSPGMACRACGHDFGKTELY